MVLAAGLVAQQAADGECEAAHRQSLMGQLATLAPPAVAEERLVPSPPATILPRDDVDGPWFIYFIAI